MLAVVCFASVLLALIGITYVAAAAWNVRSFSRKLRAIERHIGAVPVSLLKPLHGAEPRLAENLATFLDQDWDAPIQLVAGVADVDDDAIATLHCSNTGQSGRSVTLVVNPRRHGANAKISNLKNMLGAADHDVLLISDSDIAVPSVYLRRVTAALAEPGVGAVTCVYRGRGDAGFWSMMGAANLSYFFLPDVLTSVALDAGGACMGSTIALRRETLERIGGFDRFVDILADDHAIGAAVRELGLRVAVAPVVVTHASVDASLPALWRHELRWAATVRELGAAGYCGLVLTMPLPFALIGAALRPGIATGALVTTALLARLASALMIDRLAGVRSAPLLVLPFRELLRFGVFVASFFIHDVDWRGERLAMIGKGRITKVAGIS